MTMYVPFNNGALRFVFIENVLFDSPPDQQTIKDLYGETVIAAVPSPPDAGITIEFSHPNLRGLYRIERVSPRPAIFN